jgi:hypothetical protein
MKSVRTVLCLALWLASAGTLQAQIADDDIFNLMFKGIDQKSFLDDTALWTTRQISVCWENFDEVSAQDRQLVERAVQQTWSAESCLSFTGWGACRPTTKGIRIQVADTGPHVKKLGRRLDSLADGMVLNFTYANWSPACAASEVERTRCSYSIAVHEFGHALSFAHEHNRPDTPGECNEAPQGSNGNVMLTPWDKYSVMNYCNERYNNDGELSFWDKYSLRHFYCAPGGQLGGAK